MIRIGTRTSKLAMIQTELVKQKIQEHFPKEKIEIVPIITKGDVILHQPLASFGGKGVFTQEIEQQLLDKTIDIAVHSAKDVPMQLADGLCIGAVLAREDCRDVLVTRTGISAKDLPAGSVIGTSSLQGITDKSNESICGNPHAQGQCADQTAKVKRRTV